jgi:uncharacterized protein (TIGR03435 family)
MRTDSREVLAVGVFGGGSRLGDRIEMLLRRGRTFSPRASSTGIAASAIVLSALMLAGSLVPRWIAFAQQDLRAFPKFEVISIRPNNSGSTASDLGPPKGNRFTATNVYVKRLIRLAYNVQDFQIAEGPGWIESDRFDIAATAEGNAITSGQFRPMLQALLADRFRLVIHRETRQLPVFELTVAGGAPKIKETNCINESSSASNICETRVTTDTGSGLVRGHLVPMPELASVLQSITSRIVLERTGLAGRYDIDLKWFPGLTSVDDVAGPSLFTALREQLGLKLESAKGPVEVLVIDHVEKPDAN